MLSILCNFIIKIDAKYINNKTKGRMPVLVTVTNTVLRQLRANQTEGDLPDMMETLFKLPPPDRYSLCSFLNEYSTPVYQGGPRPLYTYQDIVNGLTVFPTFEKWLYFHLMNTKKHDGFVTSQQDDALATRLLDHAAKETIRLDTDNRVHITTDPDSDESDSDDDSEERTMTESVNMGENIEMGECD